MLALEGDLEDRGGMIAFNTPVENLSHTAEGREVRFGPDVEWIDAESYTVDPKRADSFYASVRTYFPALPDNSPVPDYCGIRPKLPGKGEPAADFLIEGPAGHGLPRLVHLFGIESRGLTSSLSIAADVVGQIQ